MNLTSFEKRAISLVAWLARSSQEDPNKLVSTTVLSKQSNISVSYIEQVVAILLKLEIVQSVKGPGGGYRLNKKAEFLMLDTFIGLRPKRSKNQPQIKPEASQVALSKLARNSLRTLSIADVVKEMSHECH